jgi:acyl carrier protein
MNNGVEKRLMLDEVTRSVFLVVRRHLPKDVAVDDPGTDLLRSGLTSLALVGLIVDLETEFSISFSADILDAERFRSVATIAEAVRALRASGR